MITIEQALLQPPEYGSPEWLALPLDDPRRHAALVQAAERWRLLTSSPHVVDVLFEFREWCRRAGFRQTSSAVSAAANWAGLAGAPTYAELARRRAVFTTPALTPEQIRTSVARSWAALEDRRAA